MGLHDLSGDGEPDAFAAGVAVTRFGDTVKRLEDTLQIPVGNPRPLIPDQNRDVRFGARHRDVDGRVLRSLAHRVAQHVLDAASPQFAVPVSAAAAPPPHPPRPTFYSP